MGMMKVSSICFLLVPTLPVSGAGFVRLSKLLVQVIFLIMSIPKQLQKQEASLDRQGFAQCASLKPFMLCGLKETTKFSMGNV